MVKWSQPNNNNNNNKNLLYKILNVSSYNKYVYVCLYICLGLYNMNLWLD